MSANPTKINARFVAFAIVSVFSFSSASLVVSGKDAHGIVAISASNTQTAFPSKERSLELPREEEEEELAEIPLEEEDSNYADEDIVILSVGDDANDDWLNEEEDEGFDWEDVDTVETLSLYDMGRTNEGDIGQDEEEDEDEESFESLFENEYDGDEFEPTYWQLSRGVIIDDGEFGDDDDDDEEDFEDPCDSPTVNYLRGRIADEYEMWASRPTFSYSETIILPSPALMNSFDNTKSEIELIVHKEITKMLYLALTLFVFCLLLVDTFCGGFSGTTEKKISSSNSVVRRRRKITTFNRPRRARAIFISIRNTKRFESFQNLPRRKQCLLLRRRNASSFNWQIFKCYGDEY